MNNQLIKDFLEKAKLVYALGEKRVWPIPAGADKYKGDLGLLPEDTEIGSWQIPPTSAMLLHFLVLSKKAKNILELGASIGYSTIWLGLAAKETGGHVYSTEIFPAKAKIAKENYEKMGVKKNITLYEKKIEDVLKEWPKERVIDFVFMDADKQNYGYYLETMYPLMSEGAMIVVDNVGDYPEHMEDFLAKCRNLKDAATYMLEIDHGMLMIVKGGGQNLMPFITDEIPLFKAHTLKVLIKEEELKTFWVKYLSERVKLRSDYLIAPIILKEEDDFKDKNVLIFEWGPGVIAEKLIKKGARVTKVDLDEQVSSFVGLSRNQAIKYLNFKDLSGDLGKFDVIISYMFNLYLNKEELQKFFSIVEKNLKKDGRLLYGDIQPFRTVLKNKIERGVISLHNPLHTFYLNLVQLKAKLRTSDGEALLSIYQHYPLSYVFKSMQNAGLIMEEYVEPVPGKEALKKYPILFSEEDLRIPPYMFVKAKKQYE